MTASEKEVIKKLNSAIYSIIQGKIPVDFLSTEIDSETNISSELNILSNNFRTFIKRVDEGYNFINSLSKGELENDPPARNLLISPYKQLQSNLRHLTWQTQQIASGDYNQKVSFLGDFSVAFNKLIETLKEKKKLEDDMIASEKNLRELNALKDKMFSIIAHDLRGPIGNNKMLIDMLIEENDYSDTAQITEYLTLLQKSSVSVYNLLENLLNWALCQRNEMKIVPGFQKINDIVDDNINLFSVKAQFKNINLHSELNKMILAFGDMNSINLVVRNLISNALKFTPRDGEVKINAERFGRFIEVTIEDTGIGMSEDSLSKVFNPLVQFTTKGTENEFGSGLGLMLCKDLIEKNNGTITVESVINKGSIFRFTLPVCG